MMSVRRHAEQQGARQDENCRFHFHDVPPKRCRYLSFSVGPTGQPPLVHLLRRPPLWLLAGTPTPSVGPTGQPPLVHLLRRPPLWLLAGTPTPSVGPTGQPPLVHLLRRPPLWLLAGTPTPSVFV